MISTKKGQAATEFLMTYGWALMIISITVGAFVYVQYTPKQIISPSCIFSDELSCIAHQVTTSDIKFDIKNNVGQIINVTKIECTINAITRNGTIITTINSGENKIITCPSSGLVQGDLVQANVIIYYKVDGFDFPRSTEGNVVGYVSN